MLTESLQYNDASFLSLAYDAANDLAELLRLDEILAFEGILKLFEFNCCSFDDRRTGFDASLFILSSDRLSSD